MAHRGLGKGPTHGQGLGAGGETLSWTHFLFHHPMVGENETRSGSGLLRVKEGSGGGASENSAAHPADCGWGAGWGACMGLF